VITYQNSLILKEYILKYLEVDEHYAHNLLSNFSGKNGVWSRGGGGREREGVHQMGQNVR